MKSLLKTLTLIGVIILSGLTHIKAQDAPMWMFDKAHTSLNFTIKHFFSDVQGRFNDFEGMVHFDPNNLKGSKVNFSVPLKSINTDNQKRDGHLQSPDFFNAAKYPEITFVSSKFEKKGDNSFVVHGNLTIRNVTKKVALPLKVTGQTEHPMMKGTLILGLLVETTINRTDFGVGVGDWAATMVVGDEVSIRIPIELNRKI